MTETVTLTLGAPMGCHIHVLAINQPEEEIEQRLKADGDASAFVQGLLGHAPDKLSHVDVIKIDDLAGLGLIGYLQEGPGLTADSLVGHKARLDALSGYVLILHPGAFGTKTTAELGPSLTLIATLDAPHTDWSDATTLTSDAATEPAPPKVRPSDAAMSGRIAMGALIVLALLTALMIWIA